MSNDKQNTENELAMAILNGLSGPNACNAADEQRRMIPLSLADQAVAACEKEITTLRAELQRLRASSFVTAVPCEEYEKLKAEVERLRKAAVTGGYNLSEYIRMANSETLEFDNGDIFAEMTLPERIKYIVESHARLKAENERGIEQYNSIIDQQLDIIADLKSKVEHIDLYKSVVEKFFNSADLKNTIDAQSHCAIMEKLKQLPDCILDFTEEQVRDNPAWALAVFRHKVKDMQYKRVHDLNAIGGEQEENACLKAEVERLRKAGDGLGWAVHRLKERFWDADEEANKAIHDWNAAKDGKPTE